MEDEYHHWYNTRHLPDILAVPGVALARRYSVSSKMPAVALPRFAAFYGLSDVGRAVSEIIARRGTERLKSSPAVNRAQSLACIFDMGLEQIESQCRIPILLFALCNSQEIGASDRVLTAPASAIQASTAPVPFCSIQLHHHPEGVGNACVEFASDAQVYRASAISDLMREPSAI
ncbi:hypothetical protein HNQ49_002016 [Parapusillimonas granuli]|nr:hypothetical protein [Parapusillimonas granuli]